MDDANEEVDYQEEDELYGEVNGLAENEEEIEPEDMQKRVLEMEEELEQLTKLQQQVENQISTASDNFDEHSM